MASESEALLQPLQQEQLGAGASYLALRASRAAPSGEGALEDAEAALAAERERAARLGALLAARQQAAAERLAAMDQKVACLLGSADALAACTAPELEALEQVWSALWFAHHSHCCSGGRNVPNDSTCCLCFAGIKGECRCFMQELHAGMAAIRRAAARAAAREAAAEGTTCSLCMENPQGVVFGCGHQVRFACLPSAQLALTIQWTSPTAVGIAACFLITVEIA